jgi:hypothetical protein
MLVNKTIGPMEAKKALTIIAFSTELNFRMSKPAIISINPESSLNPAMAKITLSIKIIIFHSSLLYV